jgi:hypothetical protein
MPSFNISQQEGPIDMNQAIRDSQYATNLLSPSKVSKHKSEQPSSSKTTSKASTRKGKESSAKAPQEKEKRVFSETSQEKMKRRQEHKVKKEQTEKKKNRKEGTLSETPEEMKKRREERKEKESRKERKEKELKTRSNSAPEATAGTRSNEFHKVRRSASVTVGREANFGQQSEEYQQHHREQMTASRVSIAGNGILSDTASAQRSIARNISIKRDISVWTDKSCFSSKETKGKVLDELNLLRYNVKTLSFQLKSAKETIRQLDDRNARMSDQAVQLVKTEEQLEYTTEENKEYSSRVRALEQALILQESELDSALTAMAKREHDSLETGKATDPFASENIDELLSIHEESIASEEVDEQVSIRNELKAIRGELEQAQQERDMAVDKATAVSIQLAELKAEKDESHHSTENHALIEQVRARMWQQGSPTSSPGAIKRDFFWTKDVDKLGMPSNENECIDTTEDNSSVSSGASNGWNDMDYHERRSLEEACMELTL